MLKILIVDDEPPSRRRLQRLLGGIDGCEVVAEAGDAGAAEAAIARHHPDLLLLDISMPGTTGMALARTLAGHDPAPAVIFCTAHAEQALEAFDVAALDYLVKPVRAERLAAALDKARRYRVGADDQARFLRSTVGNREVLIPLEEAICMVAEDKYTTVIHDHGRSVINDPLVRLEQEFGDLLVRIHRNTLIVRERLRGLERDGAGRQHVVLEGTDERPEVSRRQLPALRRLIRRGRS